MAQPQIVFYEIPDKDPQMLVRVSCKLVCEYYRAKTNVHVLATNKTTLTLMDETLWNYPANSFVPHMRASSPQHGCLVTMECNPSFEGSGSVLINHTFEVPSCVEQFDTVCEFVLQQQQILQQARSKYVWYREKYGKPTYVNLSDWDDNPILNY